MRRAVAVGCARVLLAEAPGVLGGAAARGAQRRSGACLHIWPPPLSFLLNVSPQVLSIPPTSSDVCVCVSYHLSLLAPVALLMLARRGAARGQPLRRPLRNEGGERGRALWWAAEGTPLSLIFLSLTPRPSPLLLPAWRPPLPVHPPPQRSLSPPSLSLCALSLSAALGRRAASPLQNDPVSHVRFPACYPCFVV